MRKLRIIATILQYTFLVLGLLLYLVHSDLVAIFVPMRFVCPALLFAGGLMAVIAAVLSHSIAKSTWLTASRILIVIIAVGAGGAIIKREFFAYEESELTFRSGETRFVGTLYLPSQKEPNPPCVIIAQGSMKAPRRLYHAWADLLVRRGVAVFSFDKRGTGESGGDYESENNSSAKNLKLLGSDIAAAADQLVGLASIDTSRIGVVGVSMGGWTGVIACQKNPRISYACLISGPAVSVYEENIFSELSGDGHGDMKLSLAAIESIVDTLHPGGFTPIPALRDINVPILYIYGARDVSIPVKKSIAAIDSLRSNLGKPYRYILFPESGHLLTRPTWPFKFEDGFGDSVAQWILAQPSGSF